ncbi:MAG TPA: nucleotidyltransferase domain-containing protein [Roseiflexaceae bacterium]|jgi:predicted nucleotidyltransferase
MTTIEKPLVTQEQIQEYSDRIAAEFKPEQIILFGSYAYGAPSADSDVDLLIIMPFEGDSARKAAEIRGVVRAGFPVDLLVRTPAQVEQRIAWNDWFMREIVEKGKVVYAAAHHGVGRESRGRLRQRDA